MRRIVLEQSEIVSLSEIDNRSCVGIQWEDESKCMIIRTQEGYCSMNNKNLPNIMNVWYDNSVQGYVTRALNQGNNTNSKAFVFDNIKDLCEWMSK
jgi:hypothetical protein